ncbi:hypothetical protein BASA81_003658 [Batrachochytrium salamandrivorans]|nr:hypothetical protein BASA81_003658 [Batrachochytrium salamandrivorans]
MGAKLSATQIAKENRVENRTKTVLITGTSSGIGLAAVKALAPNGWKVICAVRNPAKMELASKDFSPELKANIEVRQLDLSSLAEVKAFVQQLPQDLELDGVICNAGLFPTKWEVTKTDGYEMCFQACHLSHHLLVRLLEPKLADKSRVVFVSSAVHSSFDLKTYEWPSEATPKGFGSDSKDSFAKMGMRAYAQAKLCNLHDALEFGKRLEQRGIMVFAVHPGVVDTGIWPWFLTGITKVLLLSPDQGAGSMVHTLTDLKLREAYHPGQYFVPPMMRGAPYLTEASKLAQNPAVSERLWVETEKIVQPFLG